SGRSADDARATRCPSARGWTAPRDERCPRGARVERGGGRRGGGAGSRDLRRPRSACMTPPSEVIVAPIVRARRRVVADLVSLTKPRVVLMILVTTVVGYYVGLGGAPDYARLVHLLVGTLLAAGGTLALN